MQCAQIQDKFINLIEIFVRLFYDHIECAMTVGAAHAHELVRDGIKFGPTDFASAYYTGLILVH